MLVGSLVSAVLGNVLPGPGPGTLYREQNLRFVRRVPRRRQRSSLRPSAQGSVDSDTKIEDMHGNLVCEGDAGIEARSATVRPVVEARHLPALIVARSRVGVLAAVETINPAMRSTLDAAILSKMARARPDQRAIVDGPRHGQRRRLEAERVASLVAGQANILIVPNIEAGNLRAKELTFIAPPVAGWWWEARNAVFGLPNVSRSEFDREPDIGGVRLKGCGRIGAPRGEADLRKF